MRKPSFSDILSKYTPLQATEHFLWARKEDYTMNYTQKNGTLVLTDISSFSLDEILECGQSFRWTAIESSPYPLSYEGIAHGKKLQISQEGTTLYFHDTTKDDFEKVWKTYFDLERDYSAIKTLFRTDDTLSKAIAHAPGIRVLQQEPWEALCSFIFSQNNNIKRISGLVQRFCQQFGEEVRDGEYSFPTPERIASLTVEDLAPVRAGFRAKYIIHAAQCVASGKVSLSLPYTLPLPEAKEHLMQIKGVGPKVSDCVLLFGFHRLECFPTDVWIQRVMSTFYPKGLPTEILPYAGLAQQYLFHYARLNPELVKE